MSSDGGGGGGDGGGAASEGGGGEGGGSCQETSPDCRSCRTCAADGPCKAQVDACLEDAICVALDECIALCGISPECEESCRAQNAVGEEAYDAAMTCLYCAACSDLCSGLVLCE